MYTFYNEFILFINPQILQSQCRAKWDTTECVCQSGTVGDDCRAICDVRPCGMNGMCEANISLAKGYKCNCRDEKQFSGL